MLRGSSLAPSHLLTGCARGTLPAMGDAFWLKNQRALFRNGKGPFLIDALNTRTKTDRLYGTASKPRHRRPPWGGLNLAFKLPAKLGHILTPHQLPRIPHAETFPINQEPCLVQACFFQISQGTLSGHLLNKDMSKSIRFP